MLHAKTLDNLYRDQNFLMKAWSKQQISEQETRNIKTKKKKGPVG